MTIADTTTQPSEFEKLLGELDVLAKACDKDDDKKIKVAAKEGGAADDDLDEDGKPKAKVDKPFAKSLKVTLEDGSVVDAEDGSEMIKALTDQLAASDARAEKLETSMTKGLGDAITLIKSQATLIKSQGEHATALEEKIAKLSSQGTGRKAVVTLTPKLTATEELNKGGDGIDLNLFMAKATDKFNEGKITGHDLAAFEAMANRGLQPSKDIIQKIVG